jgi:hypothetical protein
MKRDFFATFDVPSFDPSSLARRWPARQRPTIYGSILDLRFA